MVQQILDQTTEQYTSCEQNHVPGIDAGNSKRGTHRSFPNYSQDKHFDSNASSRYIPSKRRKREKFLSIHSFPPLPSSSKSIRQLGTNFSDFSYIFSTFQPSDGLSSSSSSSTGRSSRLITRGDPFQLCQCRVCPRFENSTRLVSGAVLSPRERVASYRQPALYRPILPGRSD